MIYTTLSFEITSSCCPWLKNVSSLSFPTVLTIAITANVVAGMVAVSVLVVIAVMEIIETGSSQGLK